MKFTYKRKFKKKNLFLGLGVIVIFLAQLSDPEMRLKIQNAVMLKQFSEVSLILLMILLLIIRNILLVFRFKKIEIDQNKIVFPRPTLFIKIQTEPVSSIKGFKSLDLPKGILLYTKSGNHFIAEENFEGDDFKKFEEKVKEITVEI